jgi:hypothetical protein
MTFLTLCRFHDEFVSLMHACLTGSHVAGSGESMDFISTLKTVDAILVG